MGISGGSLALYSAGAQGSGAAMSAIGAYSSANSQKINMQGAADIAALNAQQAEKSAQQELSRGNAQVASTTARAGQIKSAQRTAMAANGIDLSDGNAAEVLTSTDIMKEEDVNTITANAVRAAWGQRTQATNFQNEANAKRASADSISPFVSGATSLLGSASQVASSWYLMNKNGVAPKGT